MLEQLKAVDVHKIQKSRMTFYLKLVYDGNSKPKTENIVWKCSEPMGKRKRTLIVKPIAQRPTPTVMNVGSQKREI